jgi:glucokinase
MKGATTRTCKDTPLYAIGVDVGGTKIKIGLVASNGTVEEATQIETPRLGAEILPAVTAEIRKLLKCADKITGIGLGTGGIVDPWQGKVRFASALPPGWAGVEIRQTLCEAFKLPVAVDNDVNAAALAEYLFGLGERRHDLVYMAIGTGIGGGAIFQGRLYRGAQGAALDLGHMVVHANGRPCPCGKNGCLEAYASGASIEQRYLELLRGSNSCGQAQKGRDAREIFHLADEGDPLCREVVNEATTYLAVGISNLIECYDPKIIALGGGVIEAGEQLLSRLRSLAQYNNTMFPREAIRKSSLGTDAGVIGAAALVLHLGDEGEALAA